MVLNSIFVLSLVPAIICTPFQDSEYTVDKANKYIAENEGSVDQTFRLKYHFMAPIGWINDPNGFIQYKGEYHLFYQYNPYNATANEIHWGHAKSSDLVNWTHLPVALAPDQEYDAGGVFSGTSLEKDGKLYVMYTGNTDTQVQCIASSDDAIIFEKAVQNPVLKADDLPSNAQPQDFRDPKVFKRGDSYYVVTVSKTTDNTGQVLLYQSPDLINWKFKSILLEGNKEQGIMWECPDLFQLDNKDVLIISAIQMPAVGDDYHNIDSVIAFVGTVDWDEGKFKVETLKELDHGLDFYATQTLLDDKGRRVAISWMNMWGRNQPTAELNQKWAGSMTLPRVLSIRDNHLVQSPVDEISRTYGPVTILKYIPLADSSISLVDVSGRVAHLGLTVDLSKAKKFSVQVRKNGYESTVISYEVSSNELGLDRSNSGINIIGGETPPLRARQVKLPLEDNVLRLEIFLDVSSVEVFANDGTESLTAVIFPMRVSSDEIEFFAEGTVVINELRFSKIFV